MLVKRYKYALNKVRDRLKVLAYILKTKQVEILQVGLLRRR